MRFFDLMVIEKSMVSAQVYVINVHSRYSNCDLSLCGKIHTTILVLCDVIVFTNNIYLSSLMGLKVGGVVSEK